MSATVDITRATSVTGTGTSAAKHVLEATLEKRRKAEDLTLQDAMRKFEEAQLANDQATLDMVDRHIEMVRKSQALNKERARKQAIERLAQERREEQSELLAERAIRNAERRELLEAASLKRVSDEEEQHG